MIELTPGLVVDALSGAFFIALGAFVGSRVPRPRTNVLFATFSIAWGLLLLLNNVATMTPAGSVGRRVGYVSGFVLAATAAAALALLATRVPRPLERDERWLIAPAALAGAMQWFAIATPYIVDGAGVTASLGELPELAAFVVPMSLAWSAVIAATTAFLFLLALRFGRPGTTAHDRRQIALTSAGLALYPMIAGVTYYPLEGATLAPMAAAIGLLLALSGVWLWNTRGEGSSLARNLALLIPGGMLVGLLMLVFTTPEQIRMSGAYGVARAIGVGLLAYAILRHQLFDIDVRMRWTIQRSTLAAVFVGVFFVVSESAAAVFSDWSGSTFLGIAAAGGLLFALAPLQRVAERVAHAAVPTVADPRSGAPVDTERAYRTAVEMALSDGVLTREEDRSLARLATQLGLDPERAFLIREEIQHPAGA